MNSHIRHILENPAVGRPIRKIFWTLILALRTTEVFLTRNFWRMPYVRRFQHYDGHDSLDCVYVYLNNLKNACTYLPYQPKISVLIPVFKVKPEFLQETLLSISFQTYENWEVCIVDDFSGVPELTNVIDEFQMIYPDKVRFSANSTNLHISITSNHCLALATGEYSALLDHDDRLLPNSLAEIVRAINYHNSPDIIYSDERTVNEEGWPFSDPFYKPSWSPFMHLSMNYTTHLTVYRTTLMRQVGGFREGFEGSQDHDLMLRMTEASDKPVFHLPLCLYQWRAHEGSTARAAGAKPYASIAGVKAVRESCIRRGRPADVTYESNTFHYRVKFEIIQPLPKVSILIHSKNCYEQVAKCLASIFNRSNYQNFEIVLVDNASNDQRCLDLYNQYEKELSSNFRIVRDARPFNFAAQIDTGVEASTGEYLIFLRNDIEILSADWIEELLMVAQFSEVGAVGCKLLYPNGQIQHAGLLGCGREIVLKAGHKLEHNNNLYWDVLNTRHEVMAVSNSCLMVAKNRYLEVGGFDQHYFQNNYEDVDFCLKLRQKGYSNIYSPYALVAQLESVPRKEGLDEFEKQIMIAKWGQTLISDPYLNSNLNYDEYYSVDRIKSLLDINWNLLDLRKMPISPQANTLVKKWAYESKG